MPAPRVLIVEDEDVVRDLVAFNLRAADLEVVTVDSIAGAMAQVEREPPDVLVFDRMLPDGDGLELCGTREINLRPLELKLLHRLFEANGELVTRTELLNAVWGVDSTARPRLVDVHVWRLRARLEDHGDLIATVHGSGYRVAEE